MMLKSKKTTEFQERVYTACCKIPPGNVTTYKYLAQAIDCRSSQAVGQALRVNPYAPEVPCHRVIRSDLTCGGYLGSTGKKTLDQKKTLLRAEGVEFSASGKLQDTQKVFTYFT